MLIRHLSSYTEPDLILGVFTDKNRAENAKQEYINDTSNNDAHIRQGYMIVDLETDVIIKTFELESNELSESVFILCRYGEGFGQVFQRPEYISTTVKAIEAKAQYLASEYM